MSKHLKKKVKDDTFSHPFFPPFASSRPFMCVSRLSRILLGAWRNNNNSSMNKPKHYINVMCFTSSVLEAGVRKFYRKGLTHKKHTNMWMESLVKAPHPENRHRTPRYYGYRAFDRLERWVLIVWICQIHHHPGVETLGEEMMAGESRVCLSVCQGGTWGCLCSL